MGKQTKITVPIVPVGPIQSPRPVGVGIGHGDEKTPAMIVPPVPAPK